ncbi:MAG TPA: pilus assembly protein N-terminal domain-containing protein [Gemmatimonadaceae bacterium]|nr:pilus assembly protein N-terminal domain-containing protein [Gemmatimonadaceae bacterium]
MRSSTRRVLVVLATAAMLPLASTARAQQDVVQRVDLPVGRSLPVTTSSPITRVSIANADVADVVVIAAREVVINAKASGETDAIVWLESGAREHYRVAVHSPADRLQIVLYVKFAEVRRDALANLGVSGLYRGDHVRAGTGLFKDDNAFDKATGNLIIPGEGQFLSVLTDFDTQKLLAFIQAEQTKGNARLLAEPNLLAANKEEATFLAGGELPIPVVTNAGASGAPQVGIQYKEFGVRLKFTAEIISDSLIKLAVRPEVSSLDFANAILISGFRIPAFRTRRVESTIDVRRDESLIISGMFDDERQRVSTGIPLLMDIPIIGRLFSSTQWQRNQTELLVVVTPVVLDPMHPRPRDTLKFAPDTTLPAGDAIRPRLQVPLLPSEPRKGPPPR